MPIPKSNVGSIAAHPIFIFVGAWTFVYFLYSLSLSGLLIYDASHFIRLYVLTIAPFVVAYWYVRLMIFGLSRNTGATQFSGCFNLGQSSAVEREFIWRRVLWLLRIWALATLVEIVVSGGLPIIWIIFGSAKNYQDFGVKSVHGLLMSMLLSCSMISFYLFLETRDRKYIAIPAFSILWFIISVTRGFLVGLILQTLYLSLTIKRPAFIQVARIVVGFVLLIVLFGVAGDLRSGGSDELIRALARPTERYPAWLPSGFLWVYIYLATPLNNLFNTVELNPSVDGITISATTSALFPTLIREIIFADAPLKSGDLVDANLNVSTEFMGPYLDMGMAGVVLFSLFLGVLASIFWTLRRKRFFFIGYAFIAHALALSIFSNIVLFLPYLFQLFWFWLLLNYKKRREELRIPLTVP